MKAKLDSDCLVGLRTMDGVVMASTPSMVTLSNQKRHRLQWLRGRVDCGGLASIQNSSILTNALFLTALRKHRGDNALGWFRGSACPQLLGGCFVLYEAGYRGTMYPRYWWTVSANTFAEAALEALLQEQAQPDLVARLDTRHPATILQRTPTS